MSIPILYTPITKVTLGWFSSQKGPCKEFEMDFYRCASHVGKYMAKEKCIKESDDLAECFYHGKQNKRYKLMQAERKKQGKPFVKVDPPESLIYW